MPATAFVDLDLDILARIVTLCRCPKSACALRRSCKQMHEPVALGSQLACARDLGCLAHQVRAVARASDSEEALMTWARVTRSQSLQAGASCANHTVLLVDDGAALATCGANESGQLGNGVVSQFSTTISMPSPSFDVAAYAARQQTVVERSDPATPSHIAISGLRRDVKFKAVAAGLKHSLALTCHGEVYGWGGGEACGIEASDATCTQPTLLCFDANEEDPAELELEFQGLELRSLPPLASPFSPAFRVQQIAAGQMHSAFLLEGGSVFCCGGGANGELGNGEHRDSSRPVRALVPEIVRSIAAGGFHTLAIGNGAARHSYGWGASSRGQLAHDATRAARLRAGDGPWASGEEQVGTPRLLAHDNAWTLIPQKHDEVGSTERNEPADGALLPLPACAQHAAGSYHTLFLTLGGFVLSCGYKSSGALGVAITPRIPGEPYAPNHDSPRLIEELADRRIVQVAAGVSHSAFLDDAGVLYTCGLAKFGRLGFTMEANFTTCLLPRRVPLPVRVRFVALGSDHTIAMGCESDDGSTLFFAFGRGSHGQLGTGDRKDRCEPVATSAGRKDRCEPQRVANDRTPAEVAS
jgi:alpha-tubulin suppressor-like RCC1 family protein